MARNVTPRKNIAPKTVETLKHDGVSRKNIPTAEYQSVMQTEAQSPVRVAYERRNRDLDPQLVWRGKDQQDRSDLVVHAPPLYIEEKIQPKVLIDDLLKQTRQQRQQEVGAQPDLFADFTGIPQGVDKTEFYLHDQNWSNRMILGDGLQVMASLTEHEGLRGVVQCIFLDPLYGIKFNSNFQWSTTSRDVKDGNVEHLKTAGVQQAHKDDTLTFTSLTPWPGNWSAPKAAISRGRRMSAGRNAPPCSSARSSAPSPALISSRLPARPAMPTSTCSSPAPLTTTPMPRSSTGSAASPCSRRA